MKRPTSFLSNMKNNPTKTEYAWSGLDAATPGRSHLLEGRPCQDAAGAWTESRPHLIVCDGRGSTPFSHFGSERAVKAFSALVRTQEDLLTRALDRENAPDGDITANEAWRLFSLSAWRALGEVQTALAGERGGKPMDFEFTLAAAIVGKHRIGCLQVGDSLLVMAQGECYGLVFPPDGDETGTATYFVTPGVSPRGLLRAGLFPAKNLRGVAAFSDGVASRMVSLRGAYPAKTFSALFEDVGAGIFTRENLHAFLNDEAWTVETGDDRSIALLAPRSNRNENVSLESHAPADLSVLAGDRMEKPGTPDTQHSPALETAPRPDRRRQAPAPENASSLWTSVAMATLMAGFILGAACVNTALKKVTAAKTGPASGAAQRGDCEP